MQDDFPSYLRFKPVTIQELLGAEGTKILIGIPGVYTPMYINVHLPGYKASLDQFKKLGVKNAAIVTTNNRYTNNDWA
jgi:peroxiredoxin